MISHTTVLAQGINTSPWPFFSSHWRLETEAQTMTLLWGQRCSKGRPKSRDRSLYSFQASLFSFLPLGDLAPFSSSVLRRPSSSKFSGSWKGNRDTVNRGISRGLGVKASAESRQGAVTVHEISPSLKREICESAMRFNFPVCFTLILSPSTWIDESRIRTQIV